MVLGKHSGRHAFKNRLHELGYEISDEEVNKLFVAFKELTEKKKEISDDDLKVLLLEEKVAAKEAAFELKSLQVQYGTSQIPTATITLLNAENELIQEAATGAGSVEAIYNTLERCVGKTINLIDYRIQSNSGGRDALAQVYVKIKIGETEASGRGMAHDVLEASAKAYINAVNRILLLSELPNLSFEASLLN
jgi:2-isopropylmalate synthase